MAVESVPKTPAEQAALLNQACRALWVCMLALEEQACDADTAIAEVLAMSVNDPLHRLLSALEAQVQS